MKKKKLSTISDVLSFYQDNEPRGEYVLVIEGKSFDELRKEVQETWQKMSIKEHMAFYEQKGINHKESMKLVAKDRGISKRDVYQSLLTETT